MEILLEYDIGFVQKLNATKVMKFADSISSMPDAVPDAVPEIRRRMGLRINPQPLGSAQMAMTEEENKTNTHMYEYFLCRICVRMMGLKEMLRCCSQCHSA